MARIQCPACRASIDGNCLTCPHCGYSLTSTPSVTPGPRRSKPPPAPLGYAPPPPVLSPARPADRDLGVDEVRLRREGGSVTTSGSVGEAWELFKSAPFELVLMFFLIDLLGSISTIEQQIRPRLDPDIAPIVTIVASLLQIAATVVQTGLTGGAIVYWLKLIRGQGPTFGDLGGSFRLLVPMFFTNLLAGLCVMGGVVLLVVPGVIIGLGFTFVMHVVVDKNLGYVDALKASWRITRGYKVELFLLGLLCAGVMLLGVLACCVGLFVAAPVVFGAVTVAYNRLAEPGNAYLEG